MYAHDRDSHFIAQNGREYHMDVEKEISKINEEIREEEEQEEQLKHRLTREKMRAAYQKKRTSC